MSCTPSSIRRFDWRGFLLVGGFALVGAVSFQGSRGIFQTTEGRYAECARETMASGDYDDPILNGQPHWTKPPLTYVAIMGGIRAFGLSPWGARAYLVPALVLSALAVWLAGTFIWGRITGFWAGLVFATSPFVVGAANVVSSDVLTTLWVALAFAAFWHGHARHSPLSILAMWVFLGLGFLTKGPPALLIPAACLPLAGIRLRREGNGRFMSWLAVVGFGLFLLVGVLWYLEEAKQTPGLLAYWFGHELVGRNLGGEFNRNPGILPVFYMYLPILLFGAGPWLPLVVFKGRPLRDWWTAPQDPSAVARAARGSLLAGAAISFAVFSLSRSKLPLYLLPIFVPLALVLGRMIAVLIAQGRVRERAAMTLAGAMVVLIVAGKGIFAHGDSPKDMTRLAAALAPELAKAPGQPFFTATGHYLNGLEFHLDRQIECIRAGDLFAHLADQVAQGKSPRYLVSKRNWGRIRPAAPASVRPTPLGRHWLLLAPAEGPDAGPPDPAQPRAENP